MERNEDRQCGPLLAPPCAWGLRASWRMHASGVVAALAQTFRPRRACDRRMDPQRSHAPAVCEPPHSGAWPSPLYVFPAKWSAKCCAPPNSGSAGAGCAYGCHLRRAVRIGSRGASIPGYPRLTVGYPTDSEFQKGGTRIDIPPGVKMLPVGCMPARSGWLLAY